MTEATPLLNDTQAAEVLGLSIHTLRIWRHQSKGPSFIKLGRSVRYDPADLRRFVEESRVSQ